METQTSRKGGFSDNVGAQLAALAAFVVMVAVLSVVAAYYIW